MAPHRSRAEWDRVRPIHGGAGRPVACCMGTCGMRRMRVDAYDRLRPAAL